MSIHAIAKRFTVLAGILLIVGAGWWALLPSKKAAEPKTDVPSVSVAETPGKKETNKNDKNDVKNKEPETKDDAANAEKERAKTQLEQLKGTWKVVYSEGELPAVKMTNEAELQKPMFYVIDKDHLTWDNGNPGDPARFVQFHVRCSDEREIDITLNSAFPDWGWELNFDMDPLLSTADKSKAPPQFDMVHGIYAFVGERLRVCWSTADCPRDLSTTPLWGKQNYSVVLQRVDANDPQTFAKEKAAEAPERQSLQGRWRIMKVNGAQDPDAKAGHDFLFQGSSLKILWRNMDDITRTFAPLLLNARANPKQIAFFNDERPSANSGIYRLDKDRLEICWRINNWRNPDQKQEEAPNKFEVGKNDKMIQLIQLERIDGAAENAAAEKTRLINLQKALVESLQSQVNGLESRIQDGKESIITIIDPVEQLMQAQLALAADKKSRFQITEAYLHRLLRYESYCQQELLADKAAEQELPDGWILVQRVTEQDVTQVKTKRLMAEILLEKEKGEAGDNKRLVEVQKALVEISQARVNFIESRIRDGKDSCAMVLEAADQLMAAHLALAADKKSRIEIMETYLQRMVGYEILYRSELFGGKSGPYELPQIKAKRLMAEILLEKEKAK